MSNSAIPWTVAHQGPLSMGFSRQEYWSRLLFPSLGDLPDPVIEPGSPAFQADSLPSEPPGKPFWVAWWNLAPSYSTLPISPTTDNVCFWQTSINFITAWWSRILLLIYYQKVISSLMLHHNAYVIYLTLSYHIIGILSSPALIKLNTVLQDILKEREEKTTST